MIEEDYVSFEVAKLLKARGFDELTRFVWYEHLPKANTVHPADIGKSKLDLYYADEQTERNMCFCNSLPVADYIYGEVFSAPTIQMTCQWLWLNHKLFVEVMPYVTEDGFYFAYKILRCGDYRVSCLSQSSGFSKPEEAYNHAFKDILINYINKQ